MPMLTWRKMSEVTCPSCGTRARIPSQDRSFRCRECGARHPVPQAQAQPTAAVNDEETAEGTSVPELHVKVETPELSSDAAQGDHELSAACPWCGTFVVPGAVCDTCGSPTPVAESLASESREAERRDAPVKRVRSTESADTRAR